MSKATLESSPDSAVKKKANLMRAVGSTFSRLKTQLKKKEQLVLSLEEKIKSRGYIFYLLHEFFQFINREDFPSDNHVKNL